MNTNTTPSANVALVQKLYAYFGQGNIPAILQELGGEIDWHVMGAPLLPYAGDYRGAGVGQFFQGMAELLDITEFTPLDFIERGDDVIAGMWVMHWQFRDGRPCAFQDYADTANLYAATLATEPVGL